MTLIEQAIEHLTSELGLDNTKTSLELLFEKSRKAHDSIHEFILIAPLMLPSTPPGKDASFHRKSAYILYHWEAFDLAHRSFIEAHCAYYNAAFILLRSTLELIIRGAFFECLAHREFREKSDIIDEDQRGTNLKKFILDIIKFAPETGRDFERISASICDKISKIIMNRNFDPSFAVMVKQLSAWGIFDGIDKPSRAVNALYGKLSPDVHALPDQTDVGRVLLYGSGKLFGPREVMPKVLEEFLDILHKVTDIGVLITLNIWKSNILEYDEVREQFGKRVNDPEFITLDLKYATKRIKQLLNEGEVK